MPYNEEASLKAFQALLKTVHRLRAPGGCPWDREQTHQSLRPYLLEETYETLEVLDQIESSDSFAKAEIKDAFIEEWGDVWLQILLHAEMASEVDPGINAARIAEKLNEKLIRRHPHVFGEVKVSGTEEVLKNWATIKAGEKSATEATKERVPSVFDSVPKGFAPIAKCLKIISKVKKVGFQWPDLNGPMQKLEEEVQELKTAIGKKEIENELGDVLFSICNIASFYNLDPEAALRGTLRKFERRFRHIETRLHEAGLKPEQSSLEEMDRYWDEAKRIEKNELKKNTHET